MDRNSFSLSGPGMPRRATTAVPEERPWNPPQRRVFSSHERRTTQANARALAQFVDRIDEPPAYAREDSKLHTPFSNPQFGRLRPASQRCPDPQMEEHASVAHSADSSDDGSGAGDDGTDDAGSQADDGEDDHGSSQDAPSFSSVQGFIDSLWLLNGAPERLQDFFDGMKEEVHHQVEELSAEKRTSARLTRNFEVSQEVAKGLQEKEIQLELQISKQRDELKAHSEQCQSLREENERLRSDMQKDRENTDKALEDMRKGLAKLSGDLKATENSLYQKEQSYELAQKEVVRLQVRCKDESKLREKVDLESQVFKREIFELRKRSNEERRNWNTSKQENELVVAKLKEYNGDLAAKTTALEGANVRLTKENQVGQKDLSKVLSFLRNIIFVVKQIHRALCVPDRLAELSTTSKFLPQTAGENCGHLDVFEKLLAGLNVAPSAELVLELASRYMEAMTDFFRFAVLQDVAHSQLVCSSHSALEQIDSNNQQVREGIRRELFRLKKISKCLHSELPVLRQQTSKALEAYKLQIKGMKEERCRLQQGFTNLTARDADVKDRLQVCKELLTSLSETLLSCKKTLDTEFRKFQKRLLSHRNKRANLYKKELEKVGTALKNLEISASTSERKLQEVQSSLPNEIARLRALLTQRDGELLKLSQSESDLRKSKDELVCRSEQSAAKEEELKKRIVALTTEKEKILDEKKNSLQRVTDAEQAARKMSAKVTEALGAKQNALEAFVREKSTTKELRSKLAEVYETKGLGQDIERPHSQQRAPRIPKTSDSHQADNPIVDNPTSAGLPSAAVSPSRRIKNDCPARVAKNNSSSQQKHEPSTSDFCDINLAPKKTKKRTSSRHQRKSAHQKRVRSNATEVAASTVGLSTSDPQSKQAGKQSEPSSNTGPQTPPTSTAERDEEWDIDVVIGKDGK